MKSSPVAALTIAALLLLAVPTLMAQSGGTAKEPSAPAAPTLPSDEMPSNPFIRGEQTIALGAGLQIPLFIAPADPAATTSAPLLLGGAFSFQYQYFISTGLALGGTIAGAFNGTVANRSTFVAPLSMRLAYWWSVLPFEFCAGGELGAYLLTMDGITKFGPFAKLGGGAFWRTSSAWSLGIQSYFWLVPEIHPAPYENLTRAAGYLEVGLAAVYHL